MSKRIVIALGGNALGNTAAEQLQLVTETAKSIVDLIAAGNEVVVAHGNGPQVGMINLGLSTAAEAKAIKADMPFPECGAMSEGYIGYHLQQAIGNELASRGMDKPVATIVTQTVVSKDDPAFQNPTKPIGTFMTEAEAEEMRRRVDDSMKMAGIYEYRERAPHNLSGGQKQRVAIAGVVAMRPDCLILDEATAMLDPRGREQVMQTIHYLNRNMGITVVSITHYMEEAAQADRVLVMSKGHVVMEGTPKEVFSQTEKVRSLHLDVPQAAELRDELVKAGIPMPEGIINTGECAQALYELLQ